LSDDITFSSATLTFHTHATEDRDNVLETISRQLSLSGETFEEVVLKGHYGNEIRRFTFHLLDEAANRFAKHLIKSLTEGDRQMISLELGSFVDEHGALYIRIDKQLLFEGRVGLSQLDSVRVKLKPKYRYKPPEMLSSYRRLLESRNV